MLLNFPLLSYQEMEMGDATRKKKKKREGILCYCTAYGWLEPDCHSPSFRYSTRSAIFRDSAALFGRGAHCTSEFSILSEMLCDLSVSIRKKRLHLREKKAKTNKHTHTHTRAHTPTHTHTRILDINVLERAPARSLTKCYVVVQESEKQKKKSSLLW